MRRLVSDLFDDVLRELDTTKMAIRAVALAVEHQIAAGLGVDDLLPVPDYEALGVRDVVVAQAR